MKSRLTLLFFLSGSSAWAGMTSFVLTDLSKARFEVISFLVLLYLLLTWLVKTLWNGLARSFPALPALNFKRALALLLVSGLFMYVILTMISGARELMTPGAWEKSGSAYSLREVEDDLRRRAMEDLKTALWDHAETHDGQFPPSIFASDIPRERWRLPGHQAYYAYLPPDLHPEILVYEPGLAGPRRYVLTHQGNIERWPEDKLAKSLRLVR